MIVLLIRNTSRRLCRIHLTDRLHFRHLETDPSEMFAQLLHHHRSVMPMTGGGQNAQEVQNRSLQRGHHETKSSTAGKQWQHPVNGLAPGAWHLGDDQSTLREEENIKANHLINSKSTNRSSRTYTDVTENGTAQQEHHPRLPLHDIRRRPMHPRHEHEEVSQEGIEWSHGLVKGSHFARFVLVGPAITNSFNRSSLNHQMLLTCKRCRHTSGHWTEQPRAVQSPWLVRRRCQISCSSTLHDPVDRWWGT